MLKLIQFIISQNVIKALSLELKLLSLSGKLNKTNTFDTTDISLPFIKNVWTV